MTIRWIGQSGYILKTKGTTLLIDPYLSENQPRLVVPPVKPQEVQADAVLCTHDHLDHLDADAAAEMAPEQRFFTTCEGAEKLRSIGRRNVTALEEGQSVQVGDFTVTAVFAKHTVEAFGLIVKAEGYVLYFSGDTLFDERLFSIAAYRPDIAFLCINGRLGNMNVAEAVETAEKIGARVSIPNHYGMFAFNTEDPTRFTRQVRGAKTLVFNREYTLEELAPKQAAAF